MPKPKKVYPCKHRGTARECDRCAQATRLEQKAALESDLAKRNDMLMEANRLRQVEAPPPLKN